jgi:hypothetical protein
MRREAKGVRLPVGTKLLYGVGSVAYGVKDGAFKSFLLIYYNQVVGLPAGLVASAILLALVADSLLDPLIGQLSDGLRSRWGRRHPFMYASALPTAGSFLLLFMPPADWSQGALFGYIVVTSILVRTFIALYEIPSSALGPELSADYDERTAIMAYRYMFAIVRAHRDETPDRRDPPARPAPRRSWLRTTSGELRAHRSSPTPGATGSRRRSGHGGRRPIRHREPGVRSRPRERSGFQATARSARPSPAFVHVRSAKNAASPAHLEVESKRRLSRNRRRAGIR